MNRNPEPGHASSKPRFTQKQGQYLAFIHAYTLVLGRPPAEADLRRRFRVTPPSVHHAKRIAELSERMLPRATVLAPAYAPRPLPSVRRPKTTLLSSILRAGRLSYAEDHVIEAKCAEAAKDRAVFEARSMGNS